MILGVPTETAANETRVALTPPVAGDLIEEGHDVLVASSAGEGSDWTDAEYSDAGCEVVDDRESVFERADVVFQVRGLGAAPEPEPDVYSEGQVVVGQLGPYDLSEEHLAALADRDVSAFSLELIPRISRAQSMDANSSMASIGGYKAIVKAAETLPELFPMQMTAAGTVHPADVFVVGAGVAGLQAISTAERLGANTRAYDIRPEVKEEVESLGADFAELDLPMADEASDEEGYAVEQEEEFLEKQREMMVDEVGSADVVITTAAVPGGNAPELVTEEMIDGMDPGSVIVDLAAAGGGNCAPTVADEVVEYNGVTIFGPTNLPGTVAHTASQLYSNNVTNFLENVTEEGELAIDLEDEIVDATLLTHDGEVRAPHLDDGDGGDAEDDTDGGDDADGGNDTDGSDGGNNTDGSDGGNNANGDNDAGDGEDDSADVDADGEVDA